MALRVPESKFWDHFYRPKPPPKPPFRPSRNPNRTSKSDFWPFYWFLPFSHWNSHCNRKKLRTAEGVVLQQKQKVFRNLWTKWNNMKPCRSWINQIFVIRITLTSQWQLSLTCQPVLWSSTCHLYQKAVLVVHPYTVQKLAQLCKWFTQKTVLATLAVLI